MRLQQTTLLPLRHKASFPPPLRGRTDVAEPEYKPLYTCLSSGCYLMLPCFRFSIYNRNSRWLLGGIYEPNTSAGQCLHIANGPVRRSWDYQPPSSPRDRQDQEYHYPTT